MRTAISQFFVENHSFIIISITVSFQVFAFLFIFLFSDPEFVMAQAANLTVTFRSEPEGIAIGQFPSLDGSNNDLTGQLRGKVGDRYSRLVPPDYCPWDENSDSVSDLDGEPRCITHLGKF